MASANFCILLRSVDGYPVFLELPLKARAGIFTEVLQKLLARE